MREMKNPHTIWASVAVIFILTTGVTILAVLDKDIVAIFSLIGTVAIPVLGAFGATLYQKLDQVKEITNGSNGRLLSMVSDLHSVVTDLALRVSPPQSDEPVMVSNPATMTGFPFSPPESHGR